jgi:hypothetical protein
MVQGHLGDDKAGWTGTSDPAGVELEKRIGQTKALGDGKDGGGQLVVRRAPQGGGDRSEGAGGISPFPVEHRVDSSLEELASRGEGDRHRTGRNQRTNEAWISSQGDSSETHDRQVTEDQPAAEHDIDQRPVDDEVDIEQSVAQKSDAGGNRHHRKTDHEERRPDARGAVVDGSGGLESERNGDPPQQP